LIALRWPRPEILLALAEAAVELRASSLEEPTVFPGSLEHDWLLFSDWLELQLFSSFTAGKSGPQVPAADLQGESFKFACCTCCNFEEPDVKGFDLATASAAPGVALKAFGEDR